MRFRTLCAAAACLLAASSPVSAGDETIAVLSSESGAYMEAFSAFQAAHGAVIGHFDASKEKPVITPETKTVVTFGIKAASQNYPSRVNLVSCMAPGFFLDQRAREGKVVKISMIPDFSRIFSKLKEIQPSLKRLTVFWMLPGYEAFSDPLKAAGAALDIRITTIKVADLDELPGLLRGQLKEMDAFWLPPDPFLASADSLMLLREFSWNNSIPYYASTKGITREGATASIGTSFADIGTFAAATVKALEAGETPAPLVFPAKVELTLNASAARKCGLEFPPGILREAGYLFP